MGDDSMNDLISRQAAIDAFNLPIYNIKGKENAERVVEYLEAVLQRIKKLPSAEPDRRRGRWEFVEDEDWVGGEYYRCSACGWGYSCKMYHEPDEFEHCPHCGAEMGPGKEEKGDS